MLWIYVPQLVPNTYRSDPCLFIEGETIMSKEGTNQGGIHGWWRCTPYPQYLSSNSRRSLLKWNKDGTQTTLQRVGRSESSVSGGQDSWDGPWLQLLCQSIKDQAYSQRRCLWRGYYASFRCHQCKDNIYRSQISWLNHRQWWIQICLCQKKVEEGKTELEKLADIAVSQPQAAYCALNQSLTPRWSYLSRTTANISEMLQPIEETIRHKVIPAIVGKSNINDIEGSSSPYQPNWKGSRLTFYQRLLTNYTPHPEPSASPWRTQ